MLATSMHIIPNNPDQDLCLWVTTGELFYEGVTNNQTNKKQRNNSVFANSNISQIFELLTPEGKHNFIAFLIHGLKFPAIFNPRFCKPVSYVPLRELS